MRHNARDVVARASPIGARMRVWRAERGLSLDQAAAASGLSARWWADLEAGLEWVDRRSVLAALAATIGRDPAGVTGQPYPPVDPEHAAVRAVAFEVRRALSEPAQRELGHTVAGLTAQVNAASNARAAGDELTLASLAPDVIQQADHLSNVVASRHSGEARQLRAQAHVLAAGLLRRLGYWDLAWRVLHQVGAAQPELVAVEEARLLLDLGMPEHALARAERAESPEPPQVQALAHAVAGRGDVARSLLNEAIRHAESTEALAALGASWVLVAVEAAAWDEAAEHGRQLRQEALTPATRGTLSIALATAEARRENISQSTTHLQAAHDAAPWAPRLNPHARELLAVLLARATDPATTRTLTRLGTHSGLF